MQRRMSGRRNSKVELQLHSLPRNVKRKMRFSMLGNAHFTRNAA
jgi:hypothetical protein